MSWVHEYMHVVTDPAHILSELTWELITAIPAFFYGKYWVKRHDKKHHGEQDETRTTV